MENKHEQQKKNKENKVVHPAILDLTATMSPSDFGLFNTLGLEMFSNIPSNIEHFVGEVKFDNGSKAKIWVYPMPAQFWKIEVFISETKRTVVVSTGSGALNDFWNTVRLIANGMLDVVYKK